jgi:hypothetical protein
LFLRPGVVLDPAWIEETAGFIGAVNERRAAIFRPLRRPAGSRPLALEALSLLGAALLGRPKPEQGLVIARSLYEELGGHEDDAAQPETGLIRRLGRRRIVMLRSGATQVAA